MRDQTVLCFAGLSVARTDPDYLILVVYDQILTGGMSGFMHALLFQLRECTGLFYSIGGSLVMGSGDQTGMIFITTTVSPENVLVSQELIEEVLFNATQSLTHERLVIACHVLING